MKILKIINVKILLSLLLVLSFLACENDNDLFPDEVTGTYTGSITSDLLNKSNNSKITNHATAIVTKVGDQIEVHCFDENFDETVMLETYHDNDAIMVCLTGSDFENTYGHRIGHGNMSENMHSNGTEWHQHLINEHQDGDEHFGNFDMQHRTFNYTFRMSHGDFHFQGTKN